MLDLQERYGCYTSTRIDLALNSREYAADLMREYSPHSMNFIVSGANRPARAANRFIIDTLNNSLHDLPDEGWQMLYRCLDEKPKKFWQRN